MEREPPYVIAHRATDGNNGPDGVQAHWRSRCSDLTQLEGAQGCREFLRKFWHVHADTSYSYLL